MTTTERPDTRTKPPRLDRMPQWRVLLHNDDVNDMGWVIDAVVEIAAIRRPEATMRMLEAHQRGISLLMTTHREHAELIEERFQSKHLTVTIEPEA